MNFDQNFIKSILPQATILYDVFPVDISFVVDSRIVQPGDIFVALPGNNRDGHEFCESALAQGASGLIIAREKKDLLKKIPESVLSQKLIILVENTASAVYDLAHAWRMQFKYPVVGITGSVGKTTTKELIKHILTFNHKKVLATQGTQNTKISVALHMLRMRADHEVAIFELGISKRGEMQELSELLRPTMGLITWIGHAHMEGLGSLADIAHEKREIFKYFNEDNIGIINGDQPLLTNVAYKHPIVKFGCKTINQIQARKVHTGSDNIDTTFKMYKQKYEVNLPYLHAGAVYNSLGATVVCYLLSISPENIIKALEVPIKVQGRFEQIPLKQYKGAIINDAYNANPESVKNALMAFGNMKTEAKKIVILGDMSELGLTSEYWHRSLGRYLSKVPSVSEIILVGKHVEETKKTVPIHAHVAHVLSWQEAVDIVKEKLTEESVILVKGSRIMELDKLVKSLT